MFQQFEIKKKCKKPLAGRVTYAESGSTYWHRVPGTFERVQQHLDCFPVVNKQTRVQLNMTTYTHNKYIFISLVINNDFKVTLAPEVH